MYFSEFLEKEKTKTFATILENPQAYNKLLIVIWGIFILINI